MTRRHPALMALLLTVLVVATGCGKKAPVATAPPPPPGGVSPFPSASNGPVGSNTRPPDPPPIPTDSVVRASPLDSWENRPVDEINGPNSPLKPVYFAYDSDEIDEAGKKVLAANADVLKTYRTWVVTVEGHSDERGTAEYNLALGDRRALAARNYLVTLGIAADRLRTVSYGEEFPFRAGHDEAAWTENRRAHFMLTSK